MRKTTKRISRIVCLTLALMSCLSLSSVLFAREPGDMDIHIQKEVAIDPAELTMKTDMPALHYAVSDYPSYYSSQIVFDHLLRMLEADKNKAETLEKSAAFNKTATIPPEAEPAPSVQTAQTTLASQAPPAPPVEVEEAQTPAAAEPVVALQPEQQYLGTFKAYAYCPCTKCCGRQASGTTATGTKATQGRTISVDPKVIPLGSVVYVNGNRYIAEDTGSSIKGNKLDIFFDSHQKALQFGVQKVEVYLEVTNG